MDQSYLELQSKIDELVRENCKLRLQIEGEDSVFGKQSVQSAYSQQPQKKEEDATALKNEALQQKMLANIGDVILILDGEKKVKYCSPNISRLYGWDEKELLGNRGFQYLHPDDADAVVFIMGDLSSEENGEEVLECRMMCRDGSFKWIELSGKNLIHDPDIAGVLVTLHDITERKKGEKALRDSEARFKILHNASFGGITIHDHGKIIECNQGLSEITGYSLDELIGMDGLQLISDSTRNIVVNNIDRNYEKPYEVIGQRKNGEQFPLRLEAKTIPYNGKTLRVVEFRDITETVQEQREKVSLEAQLRQAQKMEAVGRLAGGVAHDFNNMLSVIIGHTEIALDQIRPDSSIRSYLEEIRKAGERSADLTRHLLAFARKQTVELKVLELNKVVEGMLKMLRRLIGEDIDLEWNPADGVWPVKIDPSQIDQMLANLCVNARDAIGGVGRIIIETSCRQLDEQFCRDHIGFMPGSYSCLKISDNGCGMDRETLNYIFEPFFTTKASGKGTGLGLATVYGAVKQNKGFIDIESEPGKGTSISIFLPKHSIVEECDNEKTLCRLVDKGNETILLVEDEPAILNMTKTMLEKLGYRVLIAGSPQEALHFTRVKKERIDLLLTDVIMPEMNGRDLSRKLKEAYPSLKCIFMSGYTANVIAHHGVLQKGVNFIAKPFSRMDLAGKVREVLDDDPLLQG